ncbi:polyprenyl synthetase family protein [Brevibacterium linens]|uniref:Geranylgeranyl diphosphate synthase, type I n=1 Tax=Brevibacterium linens TaxID=1703 RepID=A0A2H1HJ02_BRELN|nr:polyprenyl synthetase family protein [Brevibacterium linens]AZU01063.1 polyprenyl synthetase [Brevibacterium linens]SMX62820.1 geranylgeranyl diphosphate synthase, type I [Brevibacterium linens]
MTSHRSVTPGDSPESAPSAAPSSTAAPSSSAATGAPPALVESLDSPESIAAEVSAQLEAFLAEKAAEFEAISPDAAAIGDALIEFTRGGKRIRPVLLWWGFQLAGGDVRAGADTGPSADVIAGLAQAAGSLELLHAAALIHDDVIDNSDTRRGRPALHRQFEARHQRSGFHGDGASFGVSASIVIGDICLALSEELFERSQECLGDSASARELRGIVRRDVMVGQYLDVLAEVIPLGDARIADRAWEVLSFKSAKYSVEQPLLLGAALAGADDRQLAEISAFGLPLGQAFQLRDDVLGIAGDPEATGKPAGDDIREGKRTVLIAETASRIPADRLEVLAARLGDPDLTDAEVAECVGMITDSGGLAAVESFIADKHAHAATIVDTWAGDGAATDSATGAAASAPVRIGPAAQERLKAFARALSYRSS